MARVPVLIPVTEFRQEAADILNRVRDSREPVVITQRGRAAGVLLGIREYERTLYERDLLRVLARGEREIQVGEGEDLDAVLKEADALLSEDP